METIGLDLESYYDKEISIKPLGVDGYLRHPQTNLYLISLYSENEAGETALEFAGPIDSPDVPWKRIKGCHAVAHNARFDETAWLVNVEKGVIPADCLPAKWSCTADLSVYLSAPRSLLDAVKQLLGVTISKAYRITALGKNWCDFADNEKEEICTAGRQDARYAFLLWKHFNAHWPECEQELSRINREMGRRGIRVNEAELDAAIIHMEHVLWEAGKTIPWEWGGNVSKTPLSPKNIGLECRKLNIPCPASFAEDSEEAQEWEEKYADTYPWINALKIWRTGNGFLSKLKHIKTRLRDGVYPYTLKYCGAHTGRFSGDGGFNMQNIYRDERFGIHLRHLFIPRAGKKFLILDFAQIEARILLWVVKDEEQLKLIRQGLSVYEVHAIRTMGWDVEKGRLKKADPNLYSLAKARVLALGYACGHIKFQVMAKTLCDLVLDLPECKKTVDDFRAKNKEICRHWQSLHSAMLSATRKPSRTFDLKLASGRVLTYFNVTAAEGMKAQPERGGTAYHYYGGKLCVTGETLVLTPRGAVPIVNLNNNDKVWDGDRWVAHRGVVYKGKAEVGRWLGIRITEGHKITDGNWWRSVIEMDEQCTLDALKWARDSVSSPSFVAELETTLRRRHTAIVVERMESARERCSEGRLSNAEHAETLKAARYGAFIAAYSPQMTSATCGHTDIRGWFLAALIRIIGRFQTTAGEEFQSTPLGLKIERFSSSLQKRWKTGMCPDSTLTGSTTQETTNPETCESAPAERIATIKGTHSGSHTTATNTATMSSGKSSAPTGLLTRFGITWNKENPRKPLWISTKRNEPVYDLFECGPNHRYAVLTDCGPVIIHNCENEIQALGRDVLRDAMIACNTHAPEYPMVIDVHDEIVFEVPEDIDETSIDRICTLMTTSSPWAQGLPLEVEWGLTDNYKK